MWFKKKRIEEPRELLNINIKNGQISSVENFNSFQTRAESSVKMVMDSIKFGLTNKKDVSFALHTGDFPEKTPEGHNFYYCTDQKESLNTVFPDFVFDHWNQVGISDFHETAEAIEQAANTPYIHPRMLWIGNTQTHPIRKKIIAYSTEFPELIEAYDTCADQFLLGDKKIPYLTLPDHTQYKYLIDLEGRGFSARLKMLLFSKRLLFIQERKWKTYYHFELEPYKHFIPVKNDLSDLLSQIEMVQQKGSAFYDEICGNALAFAKENLTYEKAVNRIQSLINHL